MYSKFMILYLIVILTRANYTCAKANEISFTDTKKCSENFKTDQFHVSRKFPIENITNESGIFLTFFVKGERDAYIIFSPKTQKNTRHHRAYEIAFGPHEKSRLYSEIRSYSDIHSYPPIINGTENKKEKNMISDKESRQFWIRINLDGEILVGKGNEEAFMTWNDPNRFQIDHYAFSSQNFITNSPISEVEWSFLCPHDVLYNQNTANFNSSQNTTNFNSSRSTTGLNSSQNTTKFTSSRGTTGLNSSRSTTDLISNQNTTDLILTSPQPSIQRTFQRKTNETLTKISQEKEVPEILNQVSALIEDATQNFIQTLDDLIIAVYVPNNTTEAIIWSYKESSSAEVKINITLPHEIVKHMKSKSIVFKMAVLKHHSHSSFDTKAKDGRLLKQGPYIIVETNATEEISIGVPALEFEIDRNQLDPPKGKWNCRFWNNQTQDWEKRGITTMKDDKYITCTSDHLSAFSIVMDPYYGTEDDDEILTIISVLGSLLTIPCLIITIFLYHRKKARRKRISSKILINCCLSLLLLHISFLIFTFFLQIFPCRILNFFVHYGVSSALLWTAADGINLWRKLFVDIFDKRKTVFYRWSKIISWGFPIITSVLGILITDYSQRDECGIYFEYNMLLKLLPCALVLMCNVIFFTIMFINVVCKDKIKSLTGRKKKYVMSLVQVFGLFWCISFPLLWLAETRLLGHIVFAVLVANQGVVIFIVRCTIEREIRCELLESALCRKKSRRISTTTTTTDYRFSLTKNSRTSVTRISVVSSDDGERHLEEI